MKSILRRFFGKRSPIEKSRQKNAPVDARSLEMEPLEPRMLFSAAPVDAPATEETGAAAEGQAQAAEESVVVSPVAAQNAAARLTDAETAQEGIAAGQTGSLNSPAESEISGTQEITLVGIDEAAAELNQETLEAIADAAAERWRETGLSEAQNAALDSIHYGIADLGGRYLGATDGFSITVDDNAAGRGWFIDSTPLQDEEFDASNDGDTQIFASAAEAIGGMDLLTALIHEQGHVLGLDDSSQSTDLISEALRAGERRFAADGLADGAVPGSLEGAHSLYAETNVSAGEMAGMQLLYRRDGFSNFDNADNYDADNPSGIVTGEFDRVAYYLELDGFWVWVSMDPFNTDPSLVGVPADGSNIVENGTVVTNLVIESNHPNVASRTVPQGIIEFWSSNYGPGGGGLFNSNDGQFDWKDSGGSTLAGHGSMQIADITPGAEEMILSITGSGIGIGTQPTGNPDWTFGPNSYSTRNLEIWVHTNDPPVVTTSAGNLSYNPGSGPQIIDASVTVTDDGANLTGATVEIVAGALPEDIIAAGTLPGGITVDGSSTATRLVLTGGATVADYETALRAVTYQNTNPTPDTTARKVSITVYDLEADTGSSDRFVSFVNPVTSSTYVWDNDLGDSDWSNPVNWDQNNGTPDIAGETAVFRTVDGTANLGGATITLDEVRFENTGAVTVTNGVLVAGTITMSGAGTADLNAEIDTATDFTITAGQLNLRNLNNDATGTATVTTGGILGAALDGGGGALGNVNVDLDGGTLSILPAPEAAIIGAQGYLFSGNDVDLPGDVSQLATRILGGQVYFEQEANSLAFWGDDLFGVGNAGNPADPNNWAQSFVGTWTVDDGDGTGGESLSVKVRLVSNDDAATIYIDQNTNGLDTGDSIFNANGQGGSPTSGTLNFTEGDAFTVMLAGREGGGGSRLRPEVSYDNGSTWQPFDLTTLAVPGGVMNGTVNVLSDSAISSASTVRETTITNLVTVAGTTLSIDSVDGGQELTFGNVTVNGDATFAGSGEAQVTVENLSETAAANILYSGDAKFILPEAGTFTYTGTTTIDGATVFAEGTTVAASSDGLDQLGDSAAGTTITNGGELQFSGWFDTNNTDVRRIQETFTLAGGGALTHTSGGNANLYTQVTLTGDGTIRNQGNEFRIRRGVDIGANTLTLDSVSTIRFDDPGNNPGITGAGGNVHSSGNGVTVFDDDNSYTGQTVVMDGYLDALRNDALGTTNAALDDTVVQSGGTIRIYGNRTVSENITISGNGEANVGALENDSGVNVLSGKVTLNGDARITVNNAETSSLTVTGEVGGTGNLEKLGLGTLFFDNAVNTLVGDTTIGGGRLSITSNSGLGSDAGNDLILTGGGRLGFDGLNGTYTPVGGLTIEDGGFANISGNTTIGFDLDPEGNLFLEADAGTFDVQSAINLGFFSDINFGGAGGEIQVLNGFGNGNAPIPSANALNHYGFDRTGDDRNSLNLHNNGGMLNGGSPTTYSDFTGQAILTSGPQGNGLNFDTDADFQADGAIDQNDNYKNLFIGYLNTTETGTFEFRNSDRDDWGTMFVDIDQDGVFESTTGNLGSNNGEQLAWNNNSTFSVNLTNPQGTGRYLVAFTHLEGGGGSRIQYSFKLPSMGAQAVINPAAAGQAGLWSMFDENLTPDNNVNKTGDSVVTLLGANTFNGEVNITGGALVAAHADALSTDDIEVNVDGGTLAFSGGVIVDHDAVTIAGEGGAGQAGAISNISGDNTFNVDTIDVGESFAGTTKIGSDDGTLTINAKDGTSAAAFDLNASALGFDGAGDLNLNADITESIGVSNVSVIDAWAFNGNAFRNPGDPNQLAAIETDALVNYQNDGEWSSLFGISLVDNYGATFIGDLTVAGAGNQEIEVRLTGVDDGNEIWIDLDQSGTFESGGTTGGASGRSGERIISRAHGTETSNFSGGNTVTLIGGQTYKVMLRHREGGGGSRMNPEISFDNGSTFEHFDPMGMTGASFFGKQIAADNTVTKDGSGTVTLLGDNSGLVSSITINDGLLVADGSNAGTASLGAAGGGITVNNGGGLGLADFGDLSAALDDITIGNGSLVNVSGDNTISTNVTVIDQRIDGEVTIESQEAGSTLTISSDLDLRFSKLTVDGAGDTELTGTISATHNQTVFTGQTGIFGFEMDGQVVDAQVDDDGTNSWLLVGRGRQGWEFDDDGQGAVADVSMNLGTPGAFVPAAYSEAMINDLLGDTGIDMSQVEIRLSRAADLTGSTFQEVRWTLDTETNWQWNFDSTIQIDSSIVSGPGSVISSTGANSRDFDFGGNSNRRVFTWAWGGHGNQKGFSYGNSVNNGNNAPSSFLWENGNENHAIPYTEVYIRPTSGAFFQPEPFIPDNNLMKTGTGTLTLTGANTFTDGTTVMEGALLANNASGSATGTGDVAVENGGELGGTGTVTGAVTVESGGEVNTGDSGPGTLDAVNVTFDAGSEFEVELNGTTAGSGHDRLASTGTVDLGGATFDASVGGTYTPGPGDSLTIISATAAVNGTFDGIADGDTVFVDGNPFEVDYQTNAVVLNYDDTPTLNLDDLGTGVNNDVTVTNNGGLIEVTVDGNLVLSTALTNLTSLQLDGGEGDDTFTLDYSGGFGSLPLINIDGQGNASGDDPLVGDILVIENGSFTNVIHNATDGDSGNVDLDGDGSAEITYTGLEPVIMDSGIANLTINLAGGFADVAILEDNGATPADGSSQLRTTSGTAETFTFSNPSASLTINLGAGNDSLTIDSSFSSGGGVGMFNVPLTIDGQGDTDIVTVDDVLSLPGGGLDVTAETINLDSGSVTTGGDQTYTGGTILGADTTLAGANVTFNGTVDSDATARSLHVNSAGITTFREDVGSNDALSSLTTDAAGTTVFATDPLAASTVAAGLQVYLPLDAIGVPGAGQTPDDSGNGRDGLLTGNLATGNPVDGVLGNAIDYQTDGDHVVLTGYTGVLGGAARTMSAWVQFDPAGTPDQAIMNWGQDVSLEKWTFRVQDDNGQAGAIRVEINGGAIVGSTDIRDGLLHHVVAVFDPGSVSGGAEVRDIRLYVDGQLETQSFLANNPVNTGATGAADVQIGQDFSSRDWTGLIDEAAIWDRALSDVEIAGLANRTVSVTTTGDQTYNDAVEAAGDAELNGNNVTFNSTLDSVSAANAGSVTVNTTGAGTTAFEGAVGGGAALASLTTNADGTTEINGGSVSTVTDQTYNDTVELGADTTLNGNDVTFASTLNSDGTNRTLAVNSSGGGVTSFGGAIGAASALTSITTNADGRTDISAGTIDTNGSVTFNDAVLLGANLTATENAGGDVTFASTIDSVTGGNFDLTVNTGGDTIFLDDIGNDALGALSDNAGLGNIVTNTGGNVIFRTLPDIGSLNFDAGDDDGANNTWENTGTTGGFNITGMSGQTHTLAPATALPGITGSYDYAGGTSGGNLATLEGLNEQSNVSFEIWFRPSDLTGDEILFESGGGNGVGIFLGGGSNPALSGVSDSEVTFSVTQNSFGTQTAFVSADLSGIGVGEFIQVVGTFNFAGNGTSSLYVNGQPVGTDVATTNITDWSGGDASGVGRLGGSNMGGVAGGDQGFTNYDGEISIFRVYESRLLSAAQVLANYNAIANPIANAAITVTTTGDQTYNEAALIDDTNLTLNGDNVTFNSTVDGHDAADQPVLTINSSSSGITTLSGALGATNALGGIATNSGGRTDINTDTINTNGAGASFGDAVVLGDDLTIAEAGAANVTFGYTVDSSSGNNFDLTVNTAGTTQFNGDVGETDALATLTTDAAGQTTFGPEILPVTPGADFNTDATLDTDADNRWEDTVGGTNLDFELSASVIRNTGVSALSGIDAAYNFPGGTTGNVDGAFLSAEGTANRRSFTNAPGDWSNEDVSIEIWFKPDNLTPTPTNGQILFEDGGGTGMGFFIDNNELRLRKAPGNGDVSFNISAIAGEFIQAVATYDVSAGTMELFVNGVSVGTDNPGGNDWSGSDPAAVGSRGAVNTGGIGGGQSFTESFDGQVAIFRVYRNEILTGGEVMANFNAVANLPAISVTTIGSQTINDAVSLESGTTLTATDVTLGGTVALNGNDLTIDASDTGTDSSIADSISGSGGLIKQGAATLTLNGDSTYSGDTTVESGTLRAENTTGAATGTGTTTAQTGTVLDGNGAFGPVTTESGSLFQPGVASVGTLGSGDFNTETGSTLELDLEGGAGAGIAGGHDQLVVNGAVTLNNSDLDLVIGSSFTAPAAGTEIVLIDNDGVDAVTGEFNGLPDGTIITLGITNPGTPPPALVPGQLFEIDYQGGDGNDVVLTVLAETATTNIWIDAAGNLKVTDIDGANSVDNLTIEVDGTEVVISDPDNALGTLINGAVQTSVGEVRVDVSLFTGGLMVQTFDGNDEIAIGNLGNLILPGSVMFDGGDGFDRIRYTGDDSELMTGSDASFAAEEIEFFFSDLTTTDGNISLTGTGGIAAGGGNFQGVHLLDTDLTIDGTGSVTITGAGGNTGNSNQGVQLSNGSQITTNDGNIDIDGTGGGTGVAGQGVAIFSGSDLSAGGSGALTIDGTGAGAGSVSNDGVHIAPGADLSVEDGDMTINGTSPGGSGINRGVQASGVDFTSSGAGSITITGTSDSGGSGNSGVLLSNSTLDTTGGIAMTGTGSVTITGTGSTNGLSLNEGVKLAGTDITTGGDGSIDIDGTGNGSGSGNAGVILSGDSDLMVMGAGTIDIDGTGSAAGTLNNDGVMLGATSSATVVNGNLSISGTAAGSGGNNRGVVSTGTTLTSDGSGSISVTGISSSSLTGNTGVYLSASTITTAAGTGSVTLTGTGSASGSSNNEGVKLANSHVSTGTNGGIAISGTGNGSAMNNTGVALITGSTLSAAGNGAVTILGSGGSGTSLNRGIHVMSSAMISSVDGAITLNGTGNGSASLNRGIELFASTIESTGTGSVTMTGTGSASAGAGVFNTGVYLLNSDVDAATGNVSVTGVGGSGLNFNEGVRFQSSSVTAGGTTTIAGDANANGATGIYNSGVYIFLNSTVNGDGGGSITGTGALSGSAVGFNHGVVMNLGITSNLPTVTGTAGAGATSLDRAGDFAFP